MPYPLQKLVAQLLGGLFLLLPLGAQAQQDTWYRVEMLVFSNSGGGTAEQWDATPTLTYPNNSRHLIDPQNQRAIAEPSPAQPAEDTTESSPAGEQDLRPTPFAILPTTRLEFRPAAARMQRSGRYRTLFHKAWIQPVGRKSRAPSIVLDQSGDTGQWPALQGSVKIYVSRYLYVDTNLWLNTSGEYLQSEWRMPPPPLGPPSVVSVAEVAPTETASFTLQPSSADQEPPTGIFDMEEPEDQEALPEYPYRHAVLLQQTRRMRSTEVNYIDHPMFGVVVKITPLATAETDS